MFAKMFATVPRYITGSVQTLHFALRCVIIALSFFLPQRLVNYCYRCCISFHFISL